MRLEIASIIEACEWFPSQYLVFSENVFTPLLYYSYLGSLIPTLLIAFYILAHGAKDLANRLLFLVAVCFSIWVFGAMVTWATEFPSYTMFFWTLLNIVEPFIYFFALYFFYVFTFKKDFSLVQKILFSVPLLPTLVLAPTAFMLVGYNLSDCDRNAYEGVLGTYGYAIELLYAVFIVGFAAYAAIRATSVPSRRQVLLLAGGILAFLLSFSLGNILEVFTENWYIGQYGLFGAPVFTAFLAYLIVRFKAFNLKLVGAQALVTALWLLVLSLLFVRSIENVRIVTSLTLIFVLILGIVLARSVKREVRQREVIEVQAKELEIANAKQVNLLHFISHEIKGYLTKSQAAFATIADGDLGISCEPVQELAKTALVDVRKGVNTVMDILDASNLQKGTIAFEKKEFDLARAVDETVQSLQAAAGERGIALHFVKPVTGGMLLIGDEEKIRRHVIRNLIDNSIKYTPNGSVDVELSRTPELVRLVVRDTGIGIAHDDMQHLFTEGGKGKESSKINVNSTGYGLFIAKGVVEAHGGKIWAESDGEGKGSRFIVELPLSTAISS